MSGEVETQIEAESCSFDAPSRPGPLEMEGADSSIGFMLTKVGSAIAERFADLVCEHGIAPRQFFVLNLISEHQGESQQAIAESIGVAKSQMVAVVDELEAKGFLERRTNQNDRRQYALHVTSNGSKLLEETRAVAADYENSLRSALEPSEVEAMLSALRKLALLEGTSTDIPDAVRQKLAATG